MTTLTEMIAAKWSKLSAAAKQHAIATRASSAGYAADDGNAMVAYPDAATTLAAAKEYVSGGDWGDEGGHVTVFVYPQYSIGGQLVRDDEHRASHVVEIPASEPECADGHEHEWRSPLAVVGGIAENPGVCGNGGGVVITQVCRHCATRKVTNTWAQHDGVQGLTTTRYEADDSDAREHYEQLGRDAADALSDEEVAAGDDSWCEDEGAISVEAFRERRAERQLAGA